MRTACPHEWGEQINGFEDCARCGAKRLAPPLPLTWYVEERVGKNSSGHLREGITADGWQFLASCASEEEASQVVQLMRPLPRRPMRIRAIGPGVFR